MLWTDAETVRPGRLAPEGRRSPPGLPGRAGRSPGQWARAVSADAAMVGHASPPATPVRWTGTGSFAAADSSCPAGHSAPVRGQPGRAGVRTAVTARRARLGRAVAGRRGCGRRHGAGAWRRADHAAREQETPGRRESSQLPLL